MINASYQERCRNERERIDQALLQQAKDLGNAMHLHYDTWFAPNLRSMRFELDREVIFGWLPSGIAELPGLGPNLNERVGVARYAYTPGSFIRPNPWSTTGFSFDSTSPACRFPRSTFGTSMTRAATPTSFRSTRWRSRMALEVAAADKSSHSTKRNSTRDTPAHKPGESAPA